MALQDILAGGLGQSVNEAAEVLGKSRESAAQRAFDRDFNVGNFDSFGGDVTDGKYTEIARFTVPASTEYAWGYGSAANPRNQGYLYVDLQNSTPSAVEGSIRFKQETPTGRGSEVVADFDTERLDASKTNNEQMVPFPEQVSHDKVSKDSHLVVEMDPDANDTISSSDSDIIIPVTEYDLGEQR